jgi:hypothetical protein
MKSGTQVIKELGKHGLRGYFFTYKQSMDLVKIEDFSEVKKRIIEWGYKDVMNANDASEIVDVLKKSNAMTNSEKGCLAAMIFEPAIWLLALLFTGC